jgi:predicted phosphodiesterase/biotin operon repressor
MAGTPIYDWSELTDEQLTAAIVACGSKQAYAAKRGCARSTLDHELERRGLMLAVHRALRSVREAATGRPARETGGDALAQAVHERLVRKRTLRVEEIADQLDVSPKRVREAVEALRAGGYRIPDEQGNVIELQRVAPAKDSLHKLDPALLDGSVLRVGVVSDTHLCSNEEALAELHLAYDVFEREGVREVWHAGDFVAGVGIFRTQASEIKRHTFETQVDYLVEHYPRRRTIHTRGITGNHDIEGEFGRIGANPLIAAARKRDDIEYLGDYSAWIELPNGAWVHLLHGKGGMSYAYSYKAQKLVDGYPAGRKPALLIPGHWHVKGNICARNVEVLWPGCFEWRSKFLERLGLHPKVGFHILELTIGDDGSLVRFLPEWYSFYEGRVVTGSAALAA